MIIFISKDISIKTKKWFWFSFEDFCPWKRLFKCQWSFSLKCDTNAVLFIVFYLCINLKKEIDECLLMKYFNLCQYYHLHKFFFLKFKCVQRFSSILIILFGWYQSKDRTNEFVHRTWLNLRRFSKKNISQMK